MTDSRLPDSWLLNPTLDSFSDGAWRLFTRALMFCNQQGTDGDIKSLYMRHIWPWDEPEPYVSELVHSGWLEQTPTGFRIPDWEDKGQSPASQVAEYREKARLRKHKYRSSKKSPETGSVPSDGTRDGTRDVGQERSGQDRLGQDSYVEVSWPEVRQPGSPTPSVDEEIF